MRFFVFGGVRATLDDRTTVHLGKRLQELLALLLLRPNRDVPAPVLIEGLSFKPTPANLSNTLQDRIRRLRDVLSDTAQNVVVTVDGGYRLAVDPDSIDLNVFRRLATAGLAVGTSEPALAQRLLATALETARGDLPDVEPDSAFALDVASVSYLRDKVLATLAGIESAAHGRPDRHEPSPGWCLGAWPVRLAVRLAELPLLVLAEIVDEVARASGTVDRLSGGLFVASFASAGAAVQAAARLLTLVPEAPEGLLGGAVDQAGACPPSPTSERDDLASRARPGEILVSAPVQRAAATARATTRLEEVGDGLWRIGRSPVEPAGPVELRRPPVGPMIGRDDDVVAVTGLVASSRLVTIRGPGGMGKTRLATEVAALLAARHPDGVAVVDLAEADRHGGVLLAITSALGLLAEPYRPILETILDRLAERAMLLLLDNCEAFLHDARVFCEALSERCPTVRVMATSRSPLGAEGEVTYELEALAEADAILLLSALVGREVADVDGDVVVAPALVELCRLLDGMPLAIECAASVVRGCGLEATARAIVGLPDGAVLPALDAAHGGRGRHSSLEVALVMSHRRLRPHDAELFEQLSSLRGSWATEDAQVGVSESSVNLWGSLARLEEASLLKREESDRWRMLEPVRQFAATLLLRHGEHAAQAERHAWHFVALAERAQVGLRGPDEGSWFARLASAQPNLAAGLSWAEATGHADAALRLTSSLWWYWAARGMYLEGARSLERALALDGTVSPKLRAQALVATSHLSWWAGQPKRTRSASDSILELVGAADPSDPEVTWLEAWALLGAAAAFMWGGGDRSGLERSIAKGEELFAQLGDHSGVGIAQGVRSGLAWHRGDDLLCYSASNDSLAAFEAGGHQTMIAQGRRVLGLASAHIGDGELGTRLVQSGLALSEQLGDTGGLPLGLCMLGLVHRLGGRRQAAVAAFSRSLRLNRELGQVWPAVVALTFAGVTANERSRMADALRLFAAQRALTDETGIGLAPRERDAVEAALAEIGDVIDPDKLNDIANEGVELGPAGAMVLALEVLDDE